MRRWCLSLAILGLVACQAGTPTLTPTPSVQLTFTYWGSTLEKIAIEEMVVKFEAQYPHIHVDAQHFEYAEYNTRLLSLFAQGTPPDVGYLTGSYASLWAEEGKVLDLTDIFAADPDLNSRLPATLYHFGNGRILGTNTAVETVVLFYNQQVFETAGLPVPPATPATAWTWPEFVQVTQQLTVDVNGRHPTDPGFDPEHIERYALAFDRNASYPYFALLASNGGQLANTDGSRLLLDAPPAVEALQHLHDLIWKYHVMPTPAAEQNLPPRAVMLQTGQLAMEIGGQWQLLDYANLADLQLGLGVLPKLQEPTTLILGSPTVIFSGTTHLPEALLFYKFHNDPQAVDLFARGLWMPLQEHYYTDPIAQAQWLDNPAHPASAQTVLTDYTVCCVVQSPVYYLRNYGNIWEQAIKPGLEKVWSTPTVDVAATMAEVVHNAIPLMQGRWDQK